MRSKRMVGAGLTVALTGIAMVAAATLGSGTAFAGGQVPCDSTATTVPTATATPPIIGVRAAAVQRVPTCTATSTPARTKSHTPTVSPTSAATNTPEPSATRAATNTPAPPPTRTGGNEGVGVRPPATGSGDGTSGGNGMLLMMIGGVVLLGGGAMAFAGVRKR